MTPQEKADELYSKYDDLLNKDFGNPIVFDNQIKQCALISVDEIIEELLSGIDFWMERRIKYWQEVKLELNKL